MSQSLRGGPYFLLGSALAQQGRHPDAALALMRVPILHPHQRQLAAEALLAAAESLRQAGQLEQSRICLRELLRDHPKSQAAAAAKTKLELESTGG